MTDPRIDQSALDAATDALALAWMDSGSPRADAERVITTYLAAADKAATITERYQLDAAPGGTVLRDHWGNVAELAVYDLGSEKPVRTWHRTDGTEDESVPLPATIIHWGTE